MTCWAKEVGTRNYSFRGRIRPENLRHFCCAIFFLLLTGGILVFYSWERSKILEIGYQKETLREVRDDHLRREQSLVLEIQTLQTPKRIDRIAREYLGLVPLSAHQILTKTPTHSSESAPAMAYSSILSPQVRTVGVESKN